MRAQSWVDQVLNSEAARRVPVLNSEAMKQEWKSMIDGRQPYDYKIWRWLNLIRWAGKLQIDFD